MLLNKAIMKPPVYLFLFSVVLFGCIRVRPQVSITENQEPAVAEIVPQKPLPPINERLEGTVWVASDMWDDIPIGDVVDIYTFTKNEIHYQGYSLSPDYRSVNRSSSIFPYSVVDDKMIEYVTQNTDTKQYEKTTMRLNDDNTLIKNTFYYPGHWKVKAGEANVGDVNFVIPYYLYSAELRDMDYTKDLLLEGTTWVVAHRKENADGSYYYEANTKMNITFNENTFVKNSLDGTIREGPYTLTAKYILLDTYYPTGFGGQDAVAVVQGEKMIISPVFQRYIATNCFIKKTD
jgi:hypothetical protein